MGVHLVDMNTFIHYGAPSSIDDYFQGSVEEEEAERRHVQKSSGLHVIVHCRDHEVAAVRHYLENKTVCGYLIILINICHLLV